MRDDDGLDLSALDPAGDPEHWRSFVAETLTQVEAVLRGREDPLELIAGWTRPLLLAAAAICMLLVPVEMSLEQRESKVEQVERLVSLTARRDWSEPPSASEFVDALSVDALSTEPAR